MPHESEERPLFPPGTLWERVQRKAAEALGQGALQPIPTDFQFVEQAGIRFLVRVVANLARKRREQANAGLPQPPADPLGDYDPALFVTDVSPSHYCLLNKFNVVDGHLLLVTGRFEPQEDLLNLADFTALWHCLAEYDQLGFYNAGAVAGASQRRKHLQTVRLPLADSGPPVPTEPLWQSAHWHGELGHVPRLPLVHGLARFDAALFEDPPQAARRTLSLYQAMRHALAMDGGSEPYNLLITRRWMLLVRRSRESFHAIPLNALAFAGSLLVSDEQQLATLKQFGPLTALQQVALPWHCLPPDRRFPPQ